jgi:hypothetical protein
MSMTASRTANSNECIAAGVCKPVGGYSVWSTLPPLPPQTEAAGSSSDGRPIIVVIAQMDSIDIFHDAAQVCGSQQGRPHRSKSPPYSSSRQLHWLKVWFMQLLVLLEVS